MSINNQLRSWYVSSRVGHSTRPFVVVLIDERAETWPPPVAATAATHADGIRVLDAQPDPGRDRWYVMIGPDGRGEIVVVDSEIEEAKRRSGVVSSGVAVGATARSGEDTRGASGASWSTLFLLGAVTGPIIVGAIASLFKPSPKTSEDFWEAAQRNWERNHPGRKYPGHGVR